MSDAWLSCEVLRGMFSDEVIVVVHGPRGQVHEFFVAREKLELGDEPGTVPTKARIRIRASGDPSAALAEIPSSQPRVVPVRGEDIELVA